MTCVLQDYALDFQAISLGFVAATAQPLQQLGRQRPPSSVGIWPNFVLVGMMALLLFLCDCTIMYFMTTRAWYSGGNGTAHEVTVFTSNSSLHLDLLLQILHYVTLGFTSSMVAGIHTSQRH